MKNNSLTLTAKISTVTVVALGLALFFGCPQGAVAQSNTFPSSGSAGVGTTSPGAVLEVDIGTTYTADRGNRVSGS